MIIKSGNGDPYFVDDYEFVFVNGMAWTVTIDPKREDSIQFCDDKVIVTYGPVDDKPSDIVTIFMKNVLVQQQRVRVVVPPSPDQKDEYHKLLLKAAGKTVH
jgi:hypothetical protein